MLSEAAQDLTEAHRRKPKDAAIKREIAALRKQKAAAAGAPRQLLFLVLLLLPTHTLGGSSSGGYAVGERATSSPCPANFKPVENAGQCAAAMQELKPGTEMWGPYTASQAPSVARGCYLYGTGMKKIVIWVSAVSAIAKKVTVSNSFGVDFVSTNDGLSRRRRVVSSRTNELQGINAHYNFRQQICAAAETEYSGPGVGSCPEMWPTTPFASFLPVFFILMLVSSISTLAVLCMSTRHATKWYCCCEPKARGVSLVSLFGRSGKPQLQPNNTTAVGTVRLRGDNISAIMAAVPQQDLPPGNKGAADAGDAPPAATVNASPKSVPIWPLVTDLLVMTSAAVVVIGSLSTGGGLQYCAANVIDWAQCDSCSAVTDGPPAVLAFKSIFLVLFVYVVLITNGIILATTADMMARLKVARLWLPTLAALEQRVASMANAAPELTFTVACYHYERASVRRRRHRMRKVFTAKASQRIKISHVADASTPALDGAALGRYGTICVECLAPTYTCGDAATATRLEGLKQQMCNAYRGRDEYMDFHETLSVAGHAPRFGVARGRGKFGCWVHALARVLACGWALRTFLLLRTAETTVRVGKTIWCTEPLVLDAEEEGPGRYTVAAVAVPVAALAMPVAVPVPVASAPPKYM